MEFREKWNERKFASLDPSPVQRADIARPLRSHPLSSRFLSRHVSLHALGSAPPPVFIYPHLRLPNLSTLCLVSSPPPPHPQYLRRFSSPFHSVLRTEHVASCLPPSPFVYLDRFFFRFQRIRYYWKENIWKNGNTSTY